MEGDDPEGVIEVNPCGGFVVDATVAVGGLVSGVGGFGKFGVEHFDCLLDGIDEDGGFGGESGLVLWSCAALMVSEFASAVAAAWFASHVFLGASSILQSFAF